MYSKQTSPRATARGEVFSFYFFLVFFEVMFLQAVISVSVDMLPLPGGMGISEGLFMVIFKKVFGEALLIPGLILSRGLGYYSELFLSAIFTLVAVVVFQVREHKKSKVK